MTCLECCANHSGWKFKEMSPWLLKLSFHKVKKCDFYSVSGMEKCDFCRLFFNHCATCAQQLCSSSRPFPRIIVLRHTKCKTDLLSGSQIHLSPTFSTVVLKACLCQVKNAFWHQPRHHKNFELHRAKICQATHRNWYVVYNGFSQLLSSPTCMCLLFQQ